MLTKMVQRTRTAAKIAVTFILILAAFVQAHSQSQSSATRPAAAGTGSAPAHVDYKFRNVAIVAGGFISGILPHPKQRGLVYTRTDIGGAYRWDDAAKQWVPLTDWLTAANSNMLGIEGMAVDPTDANKVYLAAGTYSQDWAPKASFLVSGDQGRSFTVVPVPFKMGGNEDGRFAGERMAVDPQSPNILYYGTRHDGLWRSTDGAKTWAQVASFPGKSTNGTGVVFVVFRPLATAAKGTPTQEILVGVSSPDANLFRSKDAGATWEAVAGTPKGILPNHGQMSADSWLYMTYGDQVGPNNMKKGAVWKWNVDTGKWRNITPEYPGEDKNPDFGYGGLAVAALPGDPGKTIVLASTMDHWNGGDDIYRSTDGGEHWKGLKDNSQMDASLSPYLAGEDGKVGFGHWMGTVALDPFDANRAWYGTGATLWTTDDLMQLDAHKPVHWTVGAKGIEETAVISFMSPPVGAHLFSGLGDIGCFRNDDFDVSPRGGSLKNPNFSNCSSMDFAAAKPEFMVRVGGQWGGQNHGALSGDSGVTWRPFSSDPPGADRGGQIAVAADASILLWETGKGFLAQSDNHGRTWKSTDKSPQRAQVVADRVHPERFFIYDPEAGKLYGADGPQVDFHELTLPVPKDGRMAATPGKPDDLWIAAKTGLWHADASNAAAPLSQIAGVDEGYAIGFGMAQKPDAYPAIYLSGRVGGAAGIFRSTDEGKSWQQIDDDQHHWGWVGVIAGDPRVFGRVFIGTNGRGVLVGEPAK